MIGAFNQAENIPDEARGYDDKNNMTKRTFPILIVYKLLKITGVWDRDKYEQGVKDC